MKRTMMKVEKMEMQMHLNMMIALLIMRRYQMNREIQMI